MSFIINTLGGLIQLCTLHSTQSKHYGHWHNHNGSQCHVLWRTRQILMQRTLFLLQAAWTYLPWMPKEVTHKCRELWCRTPMQQSRSICLIQQCFQQETWHTQEIGTSRTQQVYSSPHQQRTWTHVRYGWSWWQWQRTHWEGFLKQRATRCAPVSPTFGINHTVFGNLDNNTLLAPISITTAYDDASEIDTQMKALIDSGAEGKFIN